MKKHSNKLLGMFLNKSFYQFGSNSTYRPKHYKELLITASQGKDFVETASSINNGVDADTFFWRTKKFSCFEKMLESFNYMMHKMHKTRPFVNVAIDPKLIAYYGKKKDFFVHEYKPKKGCTGCFKFAEISVVQEKRYILHALPMHIGCYKSKIIRELLDKAKEFVKINTVLLDREFFSAEVIDLMICRRQKYIIFVPKNKFVKKVFERMKEGKCKSIMHTLLLQKEKSIYKIKTRLVFLKSFEYGNKKHDWCFATNLPYGPETIHYIYTKRWGIETTNRCMDEVRIKTKSTNIYARFFLFLFCSLLYNIWIFLREEYGITLRELVYHLFFFFVLKIDLVFVCGRFPP